MNRKQFFGNFAALLAVSTSVKELSTIGIPKIELLNTKVGDIIVAKDWVTYYNTGHEIRCIHGKNPAIPIRNVTKDKFAVMSMASYER